MTDYTPTTEQVRSGYAIDPEAEYRDPLTNHTARGEREFDRWLTAHDEEVRRDERMRWAIYLWGMDEDTDGPEGAFEEGADMAYHAVAAWLLANIARGFRVSDMPWLDPDLITDAKAKARLLPAHPDSEVHEVDRCIAVLDTIRDVLPPKGDDRV